MRSDLVILYVSVHEVLEYDDLIMLTGLGHKVFSIGRYMQPDTAGYLFRQPPERFFQSDLITLLYAEGGLTDVFLSRFDLVIVNHDVNWLVINWHLVHDMPVIYRSIGQSSYGLEAKLKEFEESITIVRYSQAEVDLPHFAKTDKVIYFAKNVDDYPEWVGHGKVLTIHNDYVARDYACVPNVRQYNDILGSEDALLFGQNNDQISKWGGHVQTSDLVEQLQNCSCYLYVWTFSPSYTLNLIEAMLVGAPIVAPSIRMIEKTVQAAAGRDHPDIGRIAEWRPARYEVPTFLQHEKGALYDDEIEATLLLNAAKDRPARILDAARAVRSYARTKFDVKRIGREWNDLFEAILK